MHLEKRKGIWLAVDAIMDVPNKGVLLVERKFFPPGWAIPGGFVEEGETVEEAVVREVLEETGMRVTALRQFHVYSAPNRDPRGHTVGVVFVAQAQGEPVGGDDAAAARFFPWEALPTMAFDHAQILQDYRNGVY